MMLKEAINYLKPISDYTTLPSYKEALELAIEVLREKEVKICRKVK